VSVVPVSLTEYSKHSRVREPDAVECGRAVDIVEAAAERARGERGISWALGADELYIRAGRELPPPSAYDGFDQVENGVGSVRWLQQQVSEGAPTLPSLAGRRVAVLTGTSMSALMPMVLDPLAASTGATFTLVTVENDLFGPRVTTAGLLSGAAIREALASTGPVDLALIPGECVNDDGLLIDSMPLAEVAAGFGAAVRPSKTFIDALTEPIAA
jgi:NifB/MoaA-like Fe-S oxidoreductase